MTSNLRGLAFRFRSGDDVRKTLEQLAIEKKIDAGFIGSSVGSLTQASLRLAGEHGIHSVAGPLEILSLSGTVGTGGVHLHMMVADSQGQCLGGHVMEGCLVNTTMEVVLIQLTGLQFDRQPDEETGFLELVIQSTKKASDSD